MDLNFFLELLRIPSVTSDVEKVNAAMELMRRHLEAHGVLCTMERCGSRNVLYASTVPGKTQDFLFNTHLDVVPAAPALFEPQLGADGILRGRGVVDCKGNAMAVAELMCALVGRASVGAVFTGDEETGGESAAYAVARGYGARRLVLVLDSAAYVLAFAQKGTVSFTLRAEGSGCHSSIPWKADNPLLRLHGAFSRVLAAWDERAAADAALLTDAERDAHWHDSLAPTMLRAGEVPNQIPDTAELTVNVRFTKPDGADRAEALLRAAAGDGVAVLRGHASPPVFCDEDNPELLRLLSAMKETWPGRDVKFGRMMGATDSRHFVPLNVPIAMFGVDGGNLHEPAEWLRLDSVDETAAMLMRFVSQP